MSRIYFHPFNWCKKDLNCKNNRDIHGFWFFVEAFNERNESILVRIRYYPWIYIHTESNSVNDLTALVSYLGRKYIKPKNVEFLKKTPPYYYGTPDVNLLKLTFNTFKEIYNVQKLLKTPISFGDDGNITYNIYELKEDCVVKYHTEQNLCHTGWHYVDEYKQSSDNSKLSDFENEIIVMNQEDVHLVEDDDKIRELGIPVPSIMSFDIECCAENEKAMPNAENPNDEVIMVSALFQNRKKEWSKYTICLNRSILVPDVHLKEVHNEAELCIAFTNLVKDLDPDIIIGHNVFKFDWKYLAYRYKRFNNELLPYIGRYYHWRLIEYGDKLELNEGRLKEDAWESSAYSDMIMNYIPAPGRIQMDLLPIIMRSGFKLDSYKLEFISQAVLGEGKIGLEPRDLFRLYKLARECARLQHLDQNDCQNSKFEQLQQIHGEDWKQQLEKIERSSMYEIDRYCVKDTELPVRIFETINLWVNLIEDSKIVHVNIFDLFTRGQGIRVFNQEYMEMMNQNYVVIKQNVTKRKYKGAFVFTALVGYYKKVHCLDFAKLYPSIMIAYNICYTTFVFEDMNNPREDIKDEDCNVFEWEENEEDDEEEENDEEEEKAKVKKPLKLVKYRFRFVKPHLRKGVLPTILERLANARDDAKAQLKKEKNAFMKIVLDKRQNNIKISMNSIYGNKGTNMAHMPLYEAAMCTTAKGRQLIHQTANFIESKYGVKVVYGDTDSVMFVNPIDEPTKFNTIYNLDTQKVSHEQGIGKKILIKNEKRVDLEQYPQLLSMFEQKMQYIQKIKQHINYGNSMRFIAKEVSSLFPPPVMLEYEKTFRNYLLVGKKMYSGMLANEKNIEEYNEKKFFCRGLPIARRDNCKYLRETMKTIFLMIFQDKNEDEVFDYIMNRLEKLINGQVEIDDLYIYKKIGKEESYKSDTVDMLFFLKYLKSKGDDPQPGDRYEYLLSTAKSKYKGEKYRTLRYLKDDNLDINYMLYFESYFAKPIQKVIHCWNPNRFAKNLFSKILTKFIEKTGQKDLKKRFNEFLASGVDIKNLRDKNQTSITQFFKVQNKQEEKEFHKRLDEMEEKQWQAIQIRNKIKQKFSKELEKLEMLKN